MIRRSLVLVILACFVVAGCGNDSRADVSVRPAAPPANVDRDHEKLNLTPIEPMPGDELMATFAESNSRGGYFHLFLWDGSTWGDPIYQLESDANRGEPTAVRITDGVGTDDYGVEGPGPDRLVLPDDLEDGYWRLCTANARDRACAPLILVGFN